MINRRACFFTILLMTLLLGGVAAGAEEWFTPTARVADYKPKGPSHCFRQFNVDWSWIAHDPAQIPEYLTAADPAGFADFCQRMHFDGTVVMAVPHHGYCTHETRVGEKFPGMKGDWFGRTIEELHRRKIAAFGYVTLNWNWKYMREHAGAPFIHAEFNPDHSWKKGEICLNAPGYLELVEAYTREVLENYPVDGMRWDILSTARGCTCEGCKALYRELYGGELSDWAKLPPGRQWDLYLATTERAVRRLHAVCKRVKPSVEIWQNSIQSYAPNNLNVGRLMDIAYNEYGDPFRLLLLKGVMNKPAAINGLMNRTTPVAPLEHDAFRWCLALGGRCYSYFGHKLTDHRTLMPSAEMMAWHEHELAPFYKMVEEIEPWLEGAQPVAHIGVVYSDATRYRFKDYKREAYVDPMQKLTESYLRRSIPLEFINSLDLAEKEKALGRFKVLVVAQSSGLDEAAVKTLRDYAEAGGAVLVAGDALRHDAQGREQKEFALADAMGVTFRGNESAGEGCEVSGSLPDGAGTPAVKVRGFVATEARQGETLLRVRRGEKAWPLLHVNRVGKGRMAYLATAEAAELMQAAADLLAGAPPVKMTPGGEHQVVLTAQPAQKRWVLHLISNGDYAIELNREFVAATRIVARYPQAGWECSVEETGGGLRIKASGAACDRLVVLQ